jgi:hypothetical protein
VPENQKPMLCLASAVASLGRNHGLVCISRTGWTGRIFAPQVAGPGPLERLKLCRSCTRHQFHDPSDASSTLRLLRAMSSDDADTFGTPRTPKVDEGSLDSPTQWQKKFDFWTIAAILSAIHLLIRPYLSKVPYLSLGFMNSRYWHLALRCVDLAFILTLVIRAPLLYTLRRREVKEPRDPTIRSKKDLVLALLSDQKLKLLIRSIFTGRYVEYDSVLPIVERNIRDFASNFAAEGWDHVAVDATDLLITDEGSHYAATILVDQALSFSLSEQRNNNSTAAPEQDSSLLITSPAYRIFKADCLHLAHEPHEKRISQWIGSAAYGETGARLEPEALEQAALEIS